MIIWAHLIIGWFKEDQTDFFSQYVCRGRRHGYKKGMVINMAAEKFSKKQFLESEKFGKYCDVISVILDGEKMYTISEAEKLINDFMKAEVV